MKIISLINRTKCRLCEKRDHIVWFLQIDNRKYHYRNEKFIREVPYDKVHVISFDKSLIENGLSVHQNAHLGCFCSFHSPHFSLETDYLPHDIEISNLDVMPEIETIIFNNYLLLIHNIERVLTIQSLDGLKTIAEVEYGKVNLTKDRINKILMLL